MTQQRDEGIGGGRTGEFELEAPDLDGDAIRQEIQERSLLRRTEATAQGIDYEAYAQGRLPLPPDAMLGRDVYEAVRHVESASEKVAVEMMLTESRVPVVGSMVQGLRRALHGLVLFYVNALAARQSRFNEETTRAFKALVRELEAQVEEQRSVIAELEKLQE
jgi:hypothetical protein